MTDNTISQRTNQKWNYWNSLKNARREYMKDVEALGGQFDAWDFEEYLRENYGLKINLLDGNIGEGYQIIDETKYTLYLLKFN